MAYETAPNVENNCLEPNFRLGGCHCGLAAAKEVDMESDGAAILTLLNR